MFLPLSVIVFSTLPDALRNEGAAMFALTRNIGNAVGISLSPARADPSHGRVAVAAGRGRAARQSGHRICACPISISDPAETMARMSGEIARQASDGRQCRSLLAGLLRQHGDDAAASCSCATGPDAAPARETAAGDGVNRMRTLLLLPCSPLRCCSAPAPSGRTSPRPAAPPPQSGYAERRRRPRRRSAKVRTTRWWTAFGSAAARRAGRSRARRQPQPGGEHAPRSSARASGSPPSPAARLPQVDANARAEYQQVNLSAFGLSATRRCGGQTSAIPGSISTRSAAASATISTCSAATAARWNAKWPRPRQRSARPRPRT